FVLWLAESAPHPWIVRVSARTICAPHQNFEKSLAKILWEYTAVPDHIQERARKEKSLSVIRLAFIEQGIRTLGVIIYRYPGYLDPECLDLGCVKSRMLRFPDT